MAHTYIIGQVGTGKSDLMNDHILSDINNGNSVFYITDTDELLSYIPYERRQDVIFFDPSDTAHPIAWNPLSTKEHIAVITSAFERALKDTAGYSTLATPQMSLYIRASLYALIEAGEPLLGLSFMLTSLSYRKKVLESGTDPLIQRFWEEFEKLPPKEKRQEVASTYNKAFSLIIDTRLRNILGQPLSAFGDLEGKIFIAYLNPTLLGLEQVQIMGHLLLSQYQLIGDGPLYVKNVHLFDGETLCQLFALADNLTVSHQNLGQISDRLRQSILGNVSRKFVFNISREDTDRLNEHLGPDNVHLELYKQNPYEARLFQGYQLEDVKVDFDWPIDDRVPKLIRENMRHNYARRESLVTKEINQFIQYQLIWVGSPVFRRVALA